MHPEGATGRPGRPPWTVGGLPMATTRLISVGQLYSYTEANTEYDAFLYLDPKSLEFFVVEGHESARRGCRESDLIPATDYVRQHPEWGKEIRQTIRGHRWAASR